MKKHIGIGIVLIGLLSACGLETYPGGDLPTAVRLSAVSIGDSKEKVAQILGVPATESIALSDGTSFIIYAQNLKSSRAFMEPEEIKRDIYVYYFDTDEKLAKSNHLTLDEARKIAYVSDETQIEGRKPSLLDQLIQNFGRYNTGSSDSSVRH